jgi:hypothetical protein
MTDDEIRKVINEAASKDWPWSVVADKIGHTEKCCFRFSIEVFTGGSLNCTCKEA